MSTPAANDVRKTVEVAVADDGWAHVLGRFASAASPEG